MASNKNRRKKRPAGEVRQWAEAARESEAGNFGKIFQFYIDQLDIEQTALAKDTGISRQEISTWYGGRKRSPGWLDAGTLAAAIYVELLKRKRSGQRFHKDIKFDAAAIMRDFLNAAGFRVTDNLDKEPIWSRLQSKARHESDDGAPTLRIGYFTWGDFAKRDRAGNFTGLSAELCSRVCELLGVRMEQNHIKLTNVAEQLEKREVDVVAPLIQMPARALEFACSKPILYLGAGIGLMAPKSANNLFRDLGKADFWTKIPWSQLQLFVVRDGVADVLLSAIGGPTNVEHCETFQEAVDSVRKDGNDRGLVKTFMADEVSCRAFKDTDFEIVRIDEVKLPVAFGLHSAESHLLAAMNLCVDIINADIRHSNFVHFDHQPTAAGFPVAPDKPITSDKSL